MKLIDAIKEMEQNMIRYTHEATAGTRFPGGAIMNEKAIERRKKSVPALEAKLEVAKKWAIQKRRSDSPLFQIERDTIAIYDLDVSEFTTGVLR